MLNWTFANNTVRTWLAAFAVLVIVIGTLHLIKTAIIRRFADRAKASATPFDDALVEMLQRTRFFFLLFTALSIAVQVLELGAVQRRVTQVAVGALLVQIGIWLAGGVGFWARQFVSGGRHADPGSVTAVTALGLLAKGAVWLVMALLVLANFGINVTALVAGLGVTGIAVALAVQSVLGDLLGALNIVVAKPFVVGETINVGDLTGTVEYVGMRTTRLRHANGEQVTVPNKQLLENSIRNLSRMTERRVPLVIGVIFETPRDVLAKIPGEMRAAVEAHGDLVRFDRAHLRGLAAGAIEYELVFWMKSPDGNAYMDVQQAVILDLLGRLEALGAELAYPAQRAVPFESRDMTPKDAGAAATTAARTPPAPPR